MVLESSVPGYSSQRPAQRCGTSLLTIAAILSYITAIGGLACVGLPIYLVACCHARTPVMDMWSIVDSWTGPTQSTIGWLWRQYNEHRIFGTKLVLLLDYRYFEGRDILAVIASFLTVATLLAALLWAFRHLARMRGTVWRSAASMAALCLFSIIQWPNFVNGFQIGFFQVDLFFTLAVLALLAADPEEEKRRGKQWKSAAAAALAGTAATYSMANGILVWPILLFAAVLHRCRRTIVAFLALSGAAATASFFFGYTQPVAGANPFRWLHQPIRVAVFIVKYLGSAVKLGHVNLAIIFGLLGLAGAGFVLWRALLAGSRDSIRLLLISLLLFVVGSASMTALGRLHMGTNEALSPRYDTVTLLLWLSLAVLLLRWAAQRSAWLLIAVQIGVLVMMGLNVGRFSTELASAKQRQFHADTASLALITGVFDETRLNFLYPNPAVPWRDVAFLKRNRLSLFATPLALQFNRPLSASYRLGSQPCWGAIESRSPISHGAGSGVRLSGWAWDPARRQSVDQVLFVANGSVVGYGQPEILGFGLHRRRDAMNPALLGHWEGYVESMPPQMAVTAYAARGHEACLLMSHLPSLQGPAGAPLSFLAGSIAK